MGRIKQYCSTLQRMRKSNGFGIHSPFAFYFVTRVLRERLPFYCYNSIEKNRHTVSKYVKNKIKHPHIISSKNAKLLFRVTNYFNPDNILQIGSNYGASSTAMLMVSSKSRLILYDAEINNFKGNNSVLSKYKSRIDFDDSVSDAIESYQSRINDGDTPFILINNINDDEYSTISEYIKQSSERGANVVIRNLTHNKRAKDLLNELKETLRFGMVFTNEQIAFVIISPKLPRQDFSLWF